MLNNAEVCHAHIEINLQDLQVCKSCKLQIQVIEFEGRDNGGRRPEMGPRPGLVALWGRRGH